MQSTNKNIKQIIPNVLTIIRIGLTPIIIAFLLIPTNLLVIYTISFKEMIGIRVNLFTILAGAFFIIASITDLLDGYLSRKWNVVSNFGKFWDPLADKILVNSTLFCLASENQNLLPIWIPILILIRDIVIDGMRLYMSNKQIVSSANIYGKIKTCLLIFAIVKLIYFGNPIANVGTLYYYLDQNLLIYFATIFSYLSAIIYTLPVIKTIRKNGNKNEF